MKNILNLTQHPATPEQIAAGVVEPQDKAAVARLLTFDTLPSSEDIAARAMALAALAKTVNADAAMIGGAPYLMGPLERALSGVCQAVYSFSVRTSTEQVQPDGSVRKVATFRHAGWVGL